MQVVTWLVQLAFDIVLFGAMVQWIRAYEELKDDYESLLTDMSIFVAFMKKQQELNDGLNQQLRNCEQFDKYIWNAIEEKAAK